MRCAKASPPASSRLAGTILSSTFRLESSTEVGLSWYSGIGCGGEDGNGERGPRQILHKERRGSGLLRWDVGTVSSSCFSKLKE